MPTDRRRAAFFCQRLQFDVARKAEDKVDVGHGRDQLHQFRPAEMAIAAHQNVGIWKVPPNLGKNTAHDHGIFDAGRAFSRTRNSGHQSPRLPVEYHQWQVAGTAVMEAVKRQRLLSVRRVLRMIQIENEAARWGRETADELFHQRLAKAIDILAADGVLEARYRRRRRQRGVAIERQATGAELEHRIVAQAVGIIAILLAQPIW